jgi:hypothetical protein
MEKEKERGAFSLAWKKPRALRLELRSRRLKLPILPIKLYSFLVW